MKKIIIKGVLIIGFISVLSFCLWNSDNMWQQNNSFLDPMIPIGENYDRGTLRIHKFTGEIQEYQWIYPNPSWERIGYAKNDVEREKIEQLFLEQWKKSDNSVSYKTEMKKFTLENFTEDN